MVYLYRKRTDIDIDIGADIDIGTDIGTDINEYNIDRHRYRYNCRNS